MPITLTATVTGALDASEKLAMIQAIVKVNQLRVDRLPFDSNVTIKSSYETILKEALDAVHIANLASATDQRGLELVGVTDEQRKRVNKFIVNAVQTGKSPEAVIAAIEAAKP